MYSEEYYLLKMDIITKPHLILLIFLGLSYSVSFAIIPNVPDKLSVKISFPSFNQQVPLGELPVFGSSSDNESANCEVYLDWNNDNAFYQARKTLRETPMLLAPVIIISSFRAPYSTHNESPVINEIMSHFETSSVFLVRRDFLI